MLLTETIDVFCVATRANGGSRRGSILSAEAETIIALFGQCNSWWIIYYNQSC